jgi:hypothetical protein
MTEKSHHHPALPSEAHECFSAAGLRACRLVVPTCLRFPVRGGPVRVVRLSFLLTAAGQLRNYTGFPFQPEGEASGTAKVK